MKKTLIIFTIFLSFLIIYFLQSNLFNWYTIAGIKPNLFVIFILFISLFAGMKVGIGFSIFFGLFLDFVLGKNLGTYTIMFTIIALIGVHLDKNFSKDSRLTIMLMVMAVTAIFEIGYYIFNIIFLKINIEILQFIKILVIEILFNAIITIIMYPTMRKLGYKIEETFKEQKILPFRVVDQNVGLDIDIFKMTYLNH